LAGATLAPLTLEVEALSVRGDGLQLGGRVAAELGPDGTRGNLRARVQVDRACFDWRDGSTRVAACPAKAAAALTLSEDRGDVRLVTVGPASVKVPAIHVDLPEGADLPKGNDHEGNDHAASPAGSSGKAPGPAASTAVDPGALGVPAWLQAATLAPVTVDVPKVEVRQGPRRIRAHARVGARAAGTGTKIAVDGAAALWSTKAGDAPPVRDAHGELALVSRASAFGGPWSLKGNVRTLLAAGDRVDGRIDASEVPSADALRFDVRGLLLPKDGVSGAQPSLQINVHGRADRHDLTVAAAARADGISPLLTAPSTATCHARAGWPQTAGGETTLALTCRSSLFPAWDDLGISALKVPRMLSIDATADGGMAIGGAAPWHGNAEVALAPVVAPAVHASAHAQATFRGPETPAARPTLAVAGHADFGTAEFADLVTALRDSPAAIPAPLNVLSGPARVVVGLKGDPLAAPLHVQLAVASRLEGKGESLVADATGAVVVPPPRPAKAGAPAAPRPSFAFDLTLTNVALSLPTLPLSPSSFPQLVPDSRITKAPAPAKVTFPYYIHVHTPPDQPLRLSVNLAKGPVPIGIDVTAASDAPLSGQILVHGVHLALFHRDARVDSFAMQLAPDGPQVKGSLQVDYTDYIVRVLVDGPLDHPVVQLTSEPPRPSNELVAILLFGRDMTELDDDQMRSADDLRSAAADGALSLASLYLLASTPVESVGYDPTTGAYTAKIALGNGTSLNVGSDFAAYEKVGVRRRLGRSWSVETFVERNTDTDNSSATAQLMWSRRF
jgi:hypothetical protein